jgi:CHAT domain-containing protein/tetratricopeptide (TPR) repeat protein
LKFFYLLLILSSSLCNSVFAKNITDAQNYLDRSDYKRAIPLFSDLSKQAKQNNNITLLVSAQNGIADCYMDLGVNYKAMDILKQNIFYLNQEPNKNFLLLAQTHRLLANCYDKLFLLEDYFRECKIFYSYYQKSNPDKKIYKALYYAYVGRYYNMRFLIDKALYCTENALKIFHSNKQDADLIDIYVLYNSHCFTLRNKHNPLEEKFKYVDSLKYFLNKRYSFDNLKKARLLVSIAALHLDLAANNLFITENKNYSIGNTNADKAIAYYNQGIVMNEKLAGYYCANTAHLFSLKGLMYFYKRDYKTALKNYDEGIARLSVLKDNFSNNNPLLMSLYNWKAWCLDDMYNQTKDKKLLYEIETNLLLAEKVWTRYASEIYIDKKSYNSTMYIDSPYSNILNNYFKLYQAIGKKTYLNLIYKYDEKSKYSALFENLYMAKKAVQQENRNASNKNKTYEAFEDFMLKLNNKIAIKGSIENYKKTFYSYLNVYSKNQKQTDFIKNSKIVSLRELQNTLTDKEAVITYNLAGNQHNHNTYSFLVTNNDVKIVDLKIKDVDYKINYIVDSLYFDLKKNNISAYRKRAYRYYLSYFKPVEKYIPKSVSHIQIIPSSSLANMPFDILLSQDKQYNDYKKLSYLGNKYNFSYALSTSISNIVDKGVSASNTFSIFSPIFKDTNLSKLFRTNESAKKLEKNYDAVLIKDKKATKIAFAEHLLKDKIVTLLSHGKSTKDYDENQKGVYFSDGFLSMNDVYNLKSNCNFLVLGGCETGVGYKIKQEGNISLGRAFTSIGVKSMMLSSWEIDEKSTNQIIGTFFDYLDKGLNKSEALEKAKLNYLVNSSPRTSNPLYWAGLNITGSNKNIALQQPNYKWSLLGFIPLFVVFWSIRKKRIKKTNR